MTPALSVIIPANNEAGYIEPCLKALIAQDWPGEGQRGEIIVAANGCIDDTVGLAQECTEAAADAGWDLIVLDIAEGNKSNALNRADASARGDMRVYLDADVICDVDLIGALYQVLDRPKPAYASGTMRVAPGKSWITRHYREIWTRLPFMTHGVQGAGLFSVNASGRTRWASFPPIIADDTYARVSFAPHERHSVAPTFLWPLPEGWTNLVKARRRQDAGTVEMHEKYPAMMVNETKPAISTGEVLRLGAKYPVSFAVYAAVKLAVRVNGHSRAWTRGR
ncbi:MAG: glycosyltransferase [Pseudomonadota bacterium]